ncbi:hypothetical protein [Flavobacterium filum]|uniref:hypothetical protein n=1 Tax=Flavobacterium filum TaxID=370974 RepID=UPI0023F1BDDF|nr:hypothetical protein [Flavobacterium filum]
MFRDLPDGEIAINKEAFTKIVLERNEFCKQNAELKFLNQKTVNVFFKVIALFGEKLPTTAVGMTMAVTSVIKKVLTDKSISSDMLSEVNEILELSPRFMTDSQLSKFNEIKTKYLHNGN